MPGLVSTGTWMGDHLRVGKTSWYVTGHPGQLRLAIPQWHNKYQRKLGRKQDTLHDALAPYPWSSSISWYLDEGHENGDQHCPMNHVAWKGLYFLYFFYYTLSSNPAACVIACCRR